MDSPSMNFEFGVGNGGKCGAGVALGKENLV